MAPLLLLPLIATLLPVCPPQPNSTGFPAALYAPDITLPAPSPWTVTSLPPGTFGMLIYSSVPHASPPIPWGSGNLCLHPAYIMRGPVRRATSAGTATGPALPEYSTRFLQYLYRDTITPPSSPPTPTFNLSNMAKAK